MSIQTNNKKIKITPHFRYWYVHLIAKSCVSSPAITEKGPRRALLLPAWTDPSEDSCYLVLLSVHTTSPADTAAALCSCQWEESEMQRRRTLHGEQSAQGQGKTWSGVAATSAGSHPGARTVPCLSAASLVMRTRTHYCGDTCWWRRGDLEV